MTPWDGLLVNAVASLMADHASDPELAGRDVDMIRAALPHASSAPPQMARLRVAAEALAVAYPVRGTTGAQWSRRRYDAGQAVAEVLRWRAAQLYGQLVGASGDPAASRSA